MPDVSKVRLPDNRVLDIISKTGRGIIRCETGSTSTSTAFVVTIPGIEELYDGIILSIKNTVVTSATNCTLNLNNLGAKRIWLSLNNTYCTSHWGLNQTYLFVYDGTNTRWELQQGRDTNDDTKVRQSLSTANSKLPLLLSYANNETTTASVDNVSYRSNNVYANPSSGVLTTNSVQIGGGSATLQYNATTQAIDFIFS